MSGEARLPTHAAFKASTLSPAASGQVAPEWGTVWFPRASAGEFLSIPLCSTALPTCLHLPLGTEES